MSVPTASAFFRTLITDSISIRFRSNTSSETDKSRGFHVLSDFVNQVDTSFPEPLPKVFRDIPSIPIEVSMKAPLG